MSGSKFSAALGRLKEPPPVERDVPPSPPPETPRMGRPPGKRSDPDWRPKTILMKAQTAKNVARILLDTDADQDLSELINELLEVWVSKQA